MPTLPAMAPWSLRLACVTVWLATILAVAGGGGATLGVTPDSADAGTAARGYALVRARWSVADAEPRESNALRASALPLLQQAQAPRSARFGPDSGMALGVPALHAHAQPVRDLPGRFTAAGTLLPVSPRRAGSVHARAPPHAA